MQSEMITKGVSLKASSLQITLQVALPVTLHKLPQIFSVVQLLVLDSALAQAM